MAGNRLAIGGAPPPVSAPSATALTRSTMRNRFQAIAAGRVWLRAEPPVGDERRKKPVRTSEAEAIVFPIGLIPVYAVRAPSSLAAEADRSLALHSSAPDSREGPVTCERLMTCQASRRSTLARRCRRLAPAMRSPKARLKRLAKFAAIVGVSETRCGYRNSSTSRSRGRRVVLSVETQ